jgi:DNA-binding NtrC family response regulator
MLRIREALEEAQGVRNRAAELIGMPLRTLVTKIKTYGLGPAPPRSRKLDKSQD